MKRTEIFCDFCGTKGATSIKKDARYETLEVIKARSRKVYIDAEKSIPSVGVVYSKRFAEGGFGEIDLCSKCRSDIEHTIESIVEGFLGKKNNKNKALERIGNKKSDRASNK